MHTKHSWYQCISTVENELMNISVLSNERSLLLTALELSYNLWKDVKINQIDVESRFSVKALVLFSVLSVQIKRTTLVDSRTSVTDVKFAPKHMGLMLTTCSADGVVRIYEAPDVMNLSQWSLQHEISCKLSCSCISWNPSRSERRLHSHISAWKMHSWSSQLFVLPFSSRAHPPMIAVGSDDSNVTYSGKVQIYEYNENTRYCISSRFTCYRL